MLTLTLYQPHTINCAFCAFSGYHCCWHCRPFFPDFSANQETLTQNAAFWLVHHSVLISRRRRESATKISIKDSGDCGLRGGCMRYTGWSVYIAGVPAEEMRWQAENRRMRNIRWAHPCRLHWARRRYLQKFERNIDCVWTLFIVFNNQCVIFE